ncbi:uncharacterized protein LOC107470131 isoform X3 [Arachis duranensis]|uniref:Uncharacterized protein LOC107470131 isoform X3 n=1 Tax=Arachis duranensis TaxID=130453 RepID=A0A9C6WJ86_ARADU|nr:uncharacterized protein LOC107470131 isoform X3 [Arachis duranensis]
MGNEMGVRDPHRCEPENSGQFSFSTTDRPSSRLFRSHEGFGDLYYWKAILASPSWVPYSSCITSWRGFQIAGEAVSCPSSSPLQEY